MNRKNNIYLLIAFSLITFSNVFGQIVIKGVVKDKTGALLPGVAVLEKRTSNGTSTDFDGNYNITLVGTANQLEFSSLIG